MRDALSFGVWLLDHWFLILWGAGVIVAFIYGGRRLAFVVLTLGVGSFAYKTGINASNKRHNERADAIDKERENAYREIDNRGTDRDDVVDRLRKGGF